MTYEELRARIDFEDCLKWIKDNLMSDVSDGSLIAVHYADRIGIEDPIGYDPTVDGVLDPDFVRYVDDLAEELLRDELWTLSALVAEDGTIDIWRAMTVSEDWLSSPKDPADLGIFWAWDPEYAITHNGHTPGDGEAEIRMHAKAHANDVDWTASVALCAADDYYVGTENEIRMLEGRTVELVSIERYIERRTYAEVPEALMLVESSSMRL